MNGICGIQVSDRIAGSASLAYASGHYGVAFRTNVMLSNLSSKATQGRALPWRQAGFGSAYQHAILDSVGRQ